MLYRNTRRIWVPRFLRENGNRTAIECLFASCILATNNCRLFVEREPSSLSISEASGTRMAQSCFVYAARWMSRLAELAKSKSLFESQWLDAARTVPESILRMRDLSGPKTSTSLNAFVLSRSRAYYNSESGDRRTTLTVIVPELESALAIRCAEADIPSIKFGHCHFEGIQPVPFVNRMHPSAAFLARVISDSEPSLGDFHFLKTTLLDIDGFRDSFALENYCEIESVQSDRKRLAAICICSGNVVWAQAPSIYLSSDFDKNIGHEMLVTPNASQRLAKQGVKIETLQGKRVRVVCAFFYTYGNSKEISLLPEILSAEETDSLGVELDDFLGFVRLRRQTTISTSRLRYPNFDSLPINSLNCLEIDASSDSIKWKGATARAKDPVNDIFIELSERLRRLRHTVSRQNGMCHVNPPSDIIDKEKLTFAKLVERLAWNPPLRTMLATLKKYDDDKGILPTPKKLISELQLSLEAEQQIAWLRDYGFISSVRKEKKTIISPTAVRALQRASKKEIRNEIGVSLKQTGAVYLGNLETNSNLPPSLLSLELQEMNKEGILRFFSDGNEKNECFWIGGDIDDAGLEKVRNEKRNLENYLLKILSSANYPLAPTKILEELRNDARYPGLYVLKILLNGLHSRNRIVVDDSGMWSYPWNNRIRDVLERTREPLDINELLAEANIPDIERNRNITMDIVEKSGHSKKLSNFSRSLRDQVRSLLKSNIEEAYDLEGILGQLPARESSDRDIQTKLPKLMEELKITGVATQLPDGRWTASFSEKEKKQRLESILKNDCIRFVFETLLTFPKGRSLEDNLRVFLIQDAAKLSVDSRLLNYSTASILSELERNGLIVRIDGLYKIAEARNSEV